MIATLQEALQFEASDLAANRKGYMTIAQQQRLADHSSRRRILVPLGIVLFCLALFLTFTLDNIGLPLGLVLALLGFVMMSPNHTDPREMSASELRVERASGIVHTMRLTIGDPCYILRVGIHSFAITEKQYDAFIANHAYIIYYLPKNHVLLSAEFAATFTDATSDTKPIRSQVVGF